MQNEPEIKFQYVKHQNIDQYHTPQQAQQASSDDTEENESKSINKEQGKYLADFTKVSAVRNSLPAFIEEPAEDQKYYQNIQSKAKIFKSKLFQNILNKTISTKSDDTMSQIDHQNNFLQMALPVGSDVRDIIAQNMQLVEKSLKINDFKKYYPKQRLVSRHCFDKQGEMRQKHKIIVAKTFCDVDHHFKAFQQQLIRLGLNMVITQSKYRSYTEGIVLQAYRELQKFLFFECQIKITPIPRNQVKKVRGVMFNCRQSLHSEESITLFNLIKIIYGLSDGCIVKSFAIKLYKKVIYALQYMYKERLTHQSDKRSNDSDSVYSKKISAKNYFRKNDSEKLTTIWNTKFEKQLLQSFEQYQNFGLIRDHFRGLYPQHQDYFTRLALQNRFHHILRVSLRKLRRIVESKYPNKLVLMKYQDKIVKKMLRQTPENRLRLSLVEVYVNPDVPYQKISQLVHAINEFVTNNGEMIYGLPVKSRKKKHDDDEIEKEIQLEYRRQNARRKRKAKSTNGSELNHNLIKYPQELNLELIDFQNTELPQLSQDFDIQFLDEIEECPTFNNINPIIKEQQFSYSKNQTST